MAEVREVREVPVLPVRKRRSGLSALFMFLFGAILILVVALVVLKPTWTISWPAGRVDIGLGHIPPIPSTRAVAPASTAALRESYVTQSAEAQAQ